MQKISTGEDSTLATYRQIASVFGDKAIAFIDQKIAESSKGGSEEVIADESQMLQLLANIQFEEL